MENLNEYKTAISRYIYGKLKIKEEAKENINKFINEPDFIDYIVNNLDGYMFREIAEKFSLPDEYVSTRANLQRQVANNYMNYDIDVVQDAICDLLFRNNRKNVKLDIATIKERAEYCEEFNKEFSKYKDLYDTMEEFVSLPKDVDRNKFENLVCKLSDINDSIKANGKNIYDIAENLYAKAEKDFEKDVSQSVSDGSKKIFNGIKPEELAVNDNKVKFYKLQNQTENQRNFFLLTRSNEKKDYMYEKDGFEKYKENLSSYGYASYSVSNEYVNCGFSTKNNGRIVFGYSSIGEGQPLSCTVVDGNTSQIELDKRKSVRKQSLLPADIFLQKTEKGRYNEVVLTNPKSVTPVFILTAKETPTEEEIKIAENMNLPIVYIDKNFYHEEKFLDRHPLDMELYDYDGTLSKPLNEIIKKEEEIEL